MKKVRCKCVKFVNDHIDEFCIGDEYDVEFAGVVWWATNDFGNRVCGHDNAFEPIDANQHVLY